MIRAAKVKALDTLDGLDTSRIAAAVTVGVNQQPRCLRIILTIRSCAAAIRSRTSAIRSACSLVIVSESLVSTRYTESKLDSVNIPLVYLIYILSHHLFITDRIKP